MYWYYEYCMYVYRYWVKLYKKVPLGRLMFFNAHELKMNNTCLINVLFIVFFMLLNTLTSMS